MYDCKYILFITFGSHSKHSNCPSSGEDGKIFGLLSSRNLIFAVKLSDLGDLSAMFRKINGSLAVSLFYLPTNICLHLKV